MGFTCFCGRPLRFMPSIRQGVSVDGQVLKAGHCSEDGWVGSDRKGPVVAVTPVRDGDTSGKRHSFRSHE